MKTEIITINSKKPQKPGLHKAISILKQGGLVILPTDTVYGLTGLASNKKAIQRIYKIKGRRKDLPLPIFCSSISQAKKIVGEINSPTHKLIKAFWPGPLTIVFPCQSAKFSHLAYQDKIGIRISKSSMISKILKELKQPIIGTSANLSGAKEIRDAKQVIKLFKSQVDLILDGGNLSRSLPSTVIDVSSDKPKILRKGKISAQRIYRVLKHEK